MPLRDRNRLLLAGGYAPVHSERALDEPEMTSALAAVESVLSSHRPFPALAVDRHWNLVHANEAALGLLDNIDATLLEPPVNVLRVSLHPEGLGRKIVNFAEWLHHLLLRLRQDADLSGDPALFALLEKLHALPSIASDRLLPRNVGIAMPLVLRNPHGGAPLSFISTTTVFGTATDITLAELTLECFFPADEETRSLLMSHR